MQRDANLSFLKKLGNSARLFDRRVYSNLLRWIQRLARPKRNRTPESTTEGGFVEL